MSFCVFLNARPSNSHAVCGSIPLSLTTLFRPWGSLFLGRCTKAKYKRTENIDTVDDLCPHFAAVEEAFPFLDDSSNVGWLGTDEQQEEGEHWGVTCQSSFVWQRCEL